MKLLILAFTLLSTLSYAARPLNLTGTHQFECEGEESVVWKLEKSDDIQDWAEIVESLSPIAYDLVGENLYMGTLVYLGFEIDFLGALAREKETGNLVFLKKIHGAGVDFDARISSPREIELINNNTQCFLKRVDAGFNGPI